MCRVHDLVRDNVTRTSRVIGLPNVHVPCPNPQNRDPNIPYKKAKLIDDYTSNKFSLITKNNLKKILIKENLI